MNEWIEAIKARRLDGAVLTALDLITPLGAIASQLLHVVHPASRLVNWQNHIAQLADLLENPEAIDALKRRLEEKD